MKSGLKLGSKNGEARRSDKECPVKAKTVEKIIRKQLAAELEECGSKGLHPEDVYWKKRRGKVRK